jgi:hypothetical protein
MNGYGQILVIFTDKNISTDKNIIDGYTQIFEDTDI